MIGANEWATAAQSSFSISCYTVTLYAMNDATNLYLVAKVSDGTLTAPAGPVETPINIKGTDFKPGSRVDLTWFGYIVDIPSIKGHIGYYPIRTGVTVGSDGDFAATIVAPYDFMDVTHFVNATQDGVGTGIVNATFTIMPSLHLGPQPTNYTEGQEIILHVYGGPLGTPQMPPKRTVSLQTHNS